VAVGVAIAENVFTIAVGDSSSSLPVQEVASFDTLSLSLSLDAGGECSFTVPGNSPTALLINELASDVWVYKSGAIFARYRIISIGQTWGPDNDDVVAITAVDYKRLMNARHVQTALTFSSVGQADIIAAIIAHTQSQPGGSWGITNGTLDNDGQIRDRSYALGENIGTILANLAGVANGPYWSIDGGLVLNVSSGDITAFPIQGTPIMLGGTARALTRSGGTGEFANSVFVDGDSASTVPAVADAPGITTDPRGRWERAVGFPSVTEQATLTQYAAGLVEEFNSPLSTWSCDIDAARYVSDAAFSPGDRVTVVVPATVAAPIGSPGFSVTGQVMNVALSFTADGSLTVSMQVIQTSAI
tara:strand:+ start:69 stop:1145 length:1077 start_codon:yes stop_codon:yes gene_type:complete